MPHRFLTLQEVAAHLHLDQQEVSMLVRRDEIPHEMVGNRPTFRRIDIDAWASKRLLKMDTQQIQDFHEASTAKRHDLSYSHALIPELMKPEFILPSMNVKTRSATIRAMVDLADSTGMLIYKDDLLEGVRQREDMASTAMAGGIALLHPPHHDPYMFDDTFIVLGRSERPIPFGELTGQMTDLFFLVCSQDDSIHLHLLARLSMICYHTSVLLDLHEAEDAETMYDALVAAEEEVMAAKTKKRG